MSPSIYKSMHSIAILEQFITDRTASSAQRGNRGDAYTREG